MVTNLSKEEVSLMLPRIPDYTQSEIEAIRFAAEEQQKGAVARAFSALGQVARGAVALVSSWPRRQRMAQELYSLSDRELADIGLSRSDIEQVVSHGAAVNDADARQARSDIRVAARAA